MKCLRPTYINNFKCDGQKCSSKCCKNWRVVVDGDAHKKFLALDDQSILSKLDFIADENIFTVKLKDNGDCPFLDADLLCSIQKKYGENFLASVCQAYPRVTYQLNDTLEQSLTLTCPVAALEILLSDEPIAFETVDIDRPRFFFDWSKNIIGVDDPINLQLKAIKILQDRALTIDCRLKNLCGLFEPVEQKSNFNANRHADIMLNIFEQMYSIGMSTDKRANLKALYLDCREPVRNILMVDSILENYLVNEFFMRCYPFDAHNDLRTNCRIFIVGFKALEFALVLTMISKGAELIVGDLINTIEAFNEKLDHNRGGMNAVKDSARNLKDFADFAAVMLDTD